MLDEKFVKEAVAGGLFKTWDPERDKWWGPQRELFAQQRFDVIRLTDPQDKTVLDVATGKGRFTISFAEAGAMQVTSVDLSKDMLAAASKRAKEAGVADKVKFEIADAEQLQYDDESFDIVCCMEVLGHLPNPLKALKEIRRVCKTGGIIVVSATDTSTYDDLHLQHKPSLIKRAVRKLGRYIPKPLYSWIPSRFLEAMRLKRPKLPPTSSYYFDITPDEFSQMLAESSLEPEQFLEYGSPVAMFTALIRKNSS